MRKINVNYGICKIADVQKFAKQKKKTSPSFALALTVGTLTGLSSVYEDYLAKSAASAEAHGSYCGSGGMEGQGVGEVPSVFNDVHLESCRKIAVGRGAAYQVSLYQRTPEPGLIPTCT